MSVQPTDRSATEPNPEVFEALLEAMRHRFGDIKLRGQSLERLLKAELAALARNPYPASQDPKEWLQRVRQTLERRLHERLQKELLVLTQRKYGWLNGKLGGSSAEDLVSEAYLRTYNGERTWKHAEVDLFFHLWRTVSSIASHEAEQLVRQSRKQHLLDDGALSAPNPCELITGDDYIAQFTKFLQHRDPRLIQVLHGKLAGDTQTEIAARLGRSNATISGMVGTLHDLLIEFGRRN